MALAVTGRYECETVQRKKQKQRKTALKAKRRKNHQRRLKWDGQSSGHSSHSARRRKRKAVQSPQLCRKGTWEYPQENNFWEARTRTTNEDEVMKDSFSRPSAMPEREKTTDGVHVCGHTCVHYRLRLRE